MYVNKYNKADNVNFTSIRVVKATSKQFLQFNKEFPDFCKKNMIFKAHSINHFNLYNSMANVAKSENSSVEWVFSNAARHGIINFEELHNSPMMVFTGIDKLKIKLKIVQSFLNILKEDILASTAQKNNVPAHLLFSSIIKNLADRQLPFFNKFLKNNKAKYLSYNEFVNEVKAGKL